MTPTAPPALSTDLGGCMEAGRCVRPSQPHQGHPEGQGGAAKPRVQQLWPERPPAPTLLVTGPQPW